MSSPSKSYQILQPVTPVVEQAAHFAEALAKGTPGGGQIALTIFRDKLNELL